jgi:hypothetical protein
MRDTSGQTYVQRHGLIETDHGDELMLVDPMSSRMFLLSGMGRALWHSLPATLPELVDALSEDPTSTEHEAARDLEELIAHLVEEGLVRAD